MKLVDYLKTHGISQNRFASLAKIPQDLVNKHVNGRCKPSSRNLVKYEIATSGAVTAKDFSDQPAPVA